MVLGGIIGTVVRTFVRTQSRNLYQVLRAQDRIIDKTYRKSGLYNRGIVTGIKHGLAGGQIIGGTLKLGLAPDTPGNDATVFQKKQPQTTTSKSYKTRLRRARRYRSCREQQHDTSFRF